MSGLAIAKLEAFVSRAPLATPVQTSFGVMADRPMVLVRATDRDDAVGRGEVWCNFPAVGAEHRARRRLRPRSTKSKTDMSVSGTLLDSVSTIRSRASGAI